MNLGNLKTVLNVFEIHGMSHGLIAKYFKAILQRGLKKN